MHCDCISDSIVPRARNMPAQGNALGSRKHSHALKGRYRGFGADLRKRIDTI